MNLPWLKETPAEAKILQKNPKVSLISWSIILEVFWKQKQNNNQKKKKKNKRIEKNIIFIN